MSDIPELPRRAPRHWLEYVSTFVAVVISLVSLWVAIGSEDANRKMVAASSWPYLEVDSSNIDHTGRSVLIFDVDNSGVGPAKVRTFEVFYKGKPYATSIALMQACCDRKFTRSPPSENPEPTDNAFTTGGIAGHVLRAGETRPFITFHLGPQSADTWHALDRAREKDITYRICYCSVFDECWFNVLAGRDELNAERVDKCPVPRVPYRE